MQHGSGNSPTKQDVTPLAELDVQARVSSARATLGQNMLQLTCIAQLQALIKFHGTEFAVHLTTVQGETLKVLVERQEDASRWQGDFSAKRAPSNLARGAKVQGP